MRIAIAQMETRAGDFEETARRMVERSRRAAEQGVDLLVFPAATLCGVTPVSRSDREGFLLDLAGCVMGLAEELVCPCLVPVLTETDGAALPDALLVDGEDIRPVGLAARLEALAAGDKDDDSPTGLPELEFAGARLGVAFTYEDLDTYDEYDYDVDVIVFLSGYGFAVDDPSSAMGSSLTEGRFPADAEATGAWIVGAASLGCYDGQVFTGSSFVLAPWGELAAQAPAFEEALLVCDVDPSAEGPLAAPLTPEVYDAPLTAWGALTTGLAAAVRRAGAEGACVALDGSLNALLVATLAVDALGPARVRALVLLTGDPTRDAASEVLVRALRLAEGSVERLDLSGEKDLVLARGLAEAHLAALAAREGCLPLGSLDKTGRALEPAPPVSAARLQPLGDVYRSDVAALARLRNTISPVMPTLASLELPVPEVVGLDELSGAEARVEFCDLVLSGYLEWDLSVSDIAAERGHDGLVAAVVSSLRAHEPARAGQTAGSITLSSRTLEEARGPLGLAWDDRVRPASERLSGRLASLASEVAESSSDEPEEGADPADSGENRERDVRDLLGYLRDFSLGGGFAPLGGTDQGGRGGEGPLSGGSFWESPFSEN
ncbi:nitrilase-related carbon-nitrogen hydrolase [Olsenella profusa]|uniref:CN hydrolase domain-containing protein n=1 Tax=Olsenella profusa TaxID=138595 RepID=A0ABS2F2T8_9ACTN|nr:nitrilase-related carbon-nitrogen hydrolase [Olsenella profusa]MBM6775299.1 hypothetical protein [Olsenella profusa]